jgi:MinD superfamily P-loop ATPase
MRTITILSGKGGVGKSSITASLAVVLSRKNKIVCTDCDVDASNLALVFGIKNEDYVEWKALSTNQKAVFDNERCISCGKCKESCYFDAIESEDGKPRLKEFSCEGCGVCEMVCPADAISMVDIDNAKIGYAGTRYGFRVVSAQLEMGGSGSGKVVSEVKKKARELAGDAKIMLVDSAAGIGCPVIASVTGSDYAIVVSEPTPSGFSDMKRAIDVVSHFRIPYGIIINKFDINMDFTANIEDFAREIRTEVLLKIPYDKAFAQALVKMVPIVEHDKAYELIFSRLADGLGLQ